MDEEIHRCCFVNSRATISLLTSQDSCPSKPLVAVNTAMHTSASTQQSALIAASMSFSSGR